MLKKNHMFREERDNITDVVNDLATVQKMINGINSNNDHRLLTDNH